MSTWTRFATSFYKNKKRQNKNYKFSQALTDASEVYKKGGGDDNKVGNPQVESENKETTTAAINRINEIIIDGLTKDQVNDLIGKLEEELKSNDESKYEVADGTTVLDVNQAIENKLNQLRDKLAGPEEVSVSQGDGLDKPEGTVSLIQGEGPVEGGKKAKKSAKKGKKSAKKGKKSAKKGGKKARKSAKKRKC